MDITGNKQWSQWRSNYDMGCLCIYYDTDIDDLLYTVRVDDVVMTFLDSGEIETGVVIHKEMNKANFFIIVKYVPSERYPYSSCVKHEMSLDRMNMMFGLTFATMRKANLDKNKSIFDKKTFHHFI